MIERIAKIVCEKPWHLASINQKRNAMITAQAVWDEISTKPGEAPHDQMSLPGAYLVSGHLFFRLRNRSVVSCNCIGEPYASQVKDACDAYRIA